MRRATLWFSLVGLGIPVVWMSLYHLVPGFPKWWYGTPTWIETMLLVVWPSSILLVADPLDQNVGLWVTSAAINFGLYALIGSITVVALSRKRTTA
jgi:hypothetical protein